MNLNFDKNKHPHKVLLVSSCIRCGPNAMLSSKIKKYLETNDHMIVQDEDTSEYVVINGCGITDWHENYSMVMIDKYLAANKKVVLLGCLSKIIDKTKLTKHYNDNEKHLFIISDLSELDSIFSTNKKIEEIIYSSHIGSTTVLSHNRYKSRFFFIWDITFNFIKMYLAILSYFKLTNIKLASFSEMHTLRNTLSVEIAKGCKGNCSYCVIRKVKGKLSSRKVEDIMEDISYNRIALMKDITTIHLVADDCGCFGHDNNSSLLQLIQAIHEKFPRFSFHIPYLNPRWAGLYRDEWHTLFSDFNISALNFPIQTASDKILKLMNRNYSFTQVKEFLTGIRKVSPHTFILTHFMVGFPGETWIDFLTNLKAIFYFDFAHVIMYSDREGTPSCLFENKVSSFTKICRFLIINIFLYINLFKLFFLSVKKSKTDLIKKS